MNCRVSVYLPDNKCISLPTQTSSAKLCEHPLPDIEETPKVVTRYAP
jgi:hypothetical protein